MSARAVLAAAQAKLLLDAAASLEQVRGSLDESSAPCTSCGLNVKHNYREAQMAGQLHSMVDRLQKFAAELSEVSRG